MLRIAADGDRPRLFRCVRLWSGIPLSGAEACGDDLRNAHEKSNDSVHLVINERQSAQSDRPLSATKIRKIGEIWKKIVIFALENLRNRKRDESFID